MRRGHLYYAALITGALVALTLAGCGTADNANPKPEEYVELGQYKELEYVIPTGEVTQEEIDDELLYLASNYPEKQTVTSGVVQEGDIANIDYTGTLNGKTFEGGSDKGIDVEIPSESDTTETDENDFGFAQKLLGEKIGETVSFYTTFSEKYEREELAGKKVGFTVKINSVKRDSIPEVTDEFIEEVSNGQYKTVDDFVAALTEEMKSENEELEESLVYSKLLDMATDNAVLIKDLPQEFIDLKYNRLIANSLSMAESYGVDFNTFLNRYMNMNADQYYSQAEDYAFKAAKQSLVVQLIAKAENITVSEDELNEAIDSYVTQYGYESKEAFTQSTDMNDFEEYILISKVQELLYDNAVITREE